MSTAIGFYNSSYLFSLLSTRKSFRNLSFLTYLWASDILFLLNILVREYSDNTYSQSKPNLGFNLDAAYLARLSDHIESKLTRRERLNEGFQSDDLEIFWNDCWKIDDKNKVSENSSNRNLL